MSDEKPWEDYANPVAPAAPTTAAPEVGYAEDIGKGFAGGLGRGTAGLIGAGGDIGGLLRSGLSKAGVPDSYIDRGAQVARALGPAVPGLGLLSGQGSADVQKDIEGVTGKFYVPKTLPGQYASTMGEFAPAAVAGGGGVGARVFNTVVPALASETAGQITKDTAAEPWARGVAGLVAGPAAAKLVTPAAAASPTWQGYVKTLDDANIPLTAGQRTGSKPLQMIESNAADMPFSAGRAAELRANQANAFDRAVTGKMFDRGELTARGVPPDVNLPNSQVVRAGKESLSDEYTRLTQNDLVSNSRLQNRMTGALNDYERLVLPHSRSANVENTRNNIVDRLLAGQGRMAGDEYQAIRSQIGTDAKAATNPREATALREIKQAMDEAFASGLTPADQMALRVNNQRYANMKQIEGAVARAGENLSPQAVAQTARVGRPGQFAAQRGDLDELSKAAATVMKPPPNSGTAARLGWQTLFNMPSVVTSGGGGVAGMLLGGPLGGLAGFAAPHVLSRLAVSRPGQAYLANQLMPQNTRDIIAQTLAQQAITQPDVIATNQANRDAYEQKRKADYDRLYVSPNRQ